MMLLVITVVTQALNNGFEYWLSIWTTAYTKSVTTAYYQTVYILLAACLVVGYFFRQVVNLSTARYPYHLCVFGSNAC
jgi:hypothetical protein